MAKLFSMDQFHGAWLTEDGRDVVITYHASIAANSITMPITNFQQVVKDYCELMDYDPIEDARDLEEEAAGRTCPKCGILSTLIIHGYTEKFNVCNCGCHWEAS